jgi:phage gpG-like protein
MMGYQDDRALQKTLGEMLQRAQNPQRPLEEIGVLMANEMKKNIEMGGRPKSWPRSIRVQASRRRVMEKYRKGKYTREEAVSRGGATLRDSGTLMNSMTSEVQGNSAAAGPTAVGRKKLSDPRILAYLAYGGTIRTKNKPFLRFPIPGGGWARVKEVTNPVRDFTYMPTETRETFGEIMQRFVVGR